MTLREELEALGLSYRPTEQEGQTDVVFLGPKGAEAVRTHVAGSPAEPENDGGSSSPAD